IAAAASLNGNYARAASDLGIDTDFYALRIRQQDEVFPWDHIDLLVRKEYLWKEYTRALESKVTSPCNVGSCARCGVCG
ncbi:MAG TPA: radical SAM protein, partial [Armatimonadota bacterium]|nr:radical SAM protein [Armatimonadota bacterium]